MTLADDKNFSCTHIVKSQAWKSETASREGENERNGHKTETETSVGQRPAPQLQQLTGKQRRATVTYVTNGYLPDTERNGKFCVLQPRVLLKSPARY